MLREVLRRQFPEVFGAYRAPSRPSVFPRHADLLQCLLQELPARSDVASQTIRQVCEEVLNDGAVVTELHFSTIEYFAIKLSLTCKQ
jgi:hypothetical protein